jgi:hypothetical protein
MSSDWFAEAMENNTGDSLDCSVIGEVQTTGSRDSAWALAFPLLGTWRSSVAHLNGVQGVAGSNPAVPTEEPGVA